MTERLHFLSFFLVCSSFRKWKHWFKMYITICLFFKHYIEFYTGIIAFESLLKKCFICLYFSSIILFLSPVRKLTTAKEKERLISWNSMSLLSNIKHFNISLLHLLPNNIISIKYILIFPDSSAGKESTCNVGNPGSIPGSGRPAGERIGYLIQCSDLENSMDCMVRWHV